MHRSPSNIEIGQLGERKAAEYLESLQFSLLEKNWRHRRLEVDIIASKGDILHFIEVKTRTSTKYGLPETAVSARKMSFLKDAAEAYQLQFPQWKKVQFDVIAVQLHFGIVKEIYTNWDVYY